MQTLPKANLVTLIVFCHILNTSKKCPKCGSYHNWGHGWYYRKGTHFSQLYIPVHRLKCQCPGCNKTFPIRPFPILPYCRFSLFHLIQIDEQQQAGLQPKEMAKGLELRMSVILRVLKYLKQVRKFIKQEFRALGHFNEANFLDQWVAIIKRLSWPGLSVRYFHSIYPLRLAGIPPHTIR
jgi:hypothetical protein